uniref:Uncharacterized protein n=1 Tax=Steinernema glaseri TaxID=37863 RepID=A0A1I7ZT72_9BILA
MGYLNDKGEGDEYTSETHPLSVSALNTSLYALFITLMSPRNKCRQEVVLPETKPASFLHISVQMMITARGMAEMKQR